MGYYKHMVWLALACTVGLLVLLWLDMKYVLRSNRRAAQLDAEGRWEELTKHLEAALRPRRLFVWLLNRLVVPGATHALYALHLNSIGDERRALEAANQAVARASRRPKLLVSALATRSLVLTSLGRYDEARADAARVRAMPGLPSSFQATGATTEYYTGRTDDLLAICHAALARDPNDDTGRGMASAAYSLRGDFKSALAILHYQPDDISKLYTPGDFAALMADTDGAAMLDAMRQQRAQVLQPVRWLHAAEVHLESDDAKGADFFLERVRGVLGAHPVVVHNYERMRAVCAALERDASRAESHLAKMWEIARRIPKRALQWESHVAVARVRLALGRFDEAIAALDEAGRVVLHPVEKHVAHYWRARIHEAAGRSEEAARSYGAVVADGIASWMSAKAQAYSASPR